MTCYNTDYRIRIIPLPLQIVIRNEVIDLPDENCSDTIRNGYTNAIDRGEYFIEIGNFPKARKEFCIAYSLANNNFDKIKALRLHSQAISMTNPVDSLKEAIEELEKARILAAGDKTLQGFIERDLGDIYLNIGILLPNSEYISYAHGCYIKSRQLFQQQGNSIVASVSRGRIGKALLCNGKLQDAIKCLVETHKELYRQHNNHEYQNLIVLCRASKYHRYRYSFRLLTLAMKSKKRKILLVEALSIFITKKNEIQTR